MNSDLVLFLSSKFILLITTIEEIVELSDAELGYQGIKTQDRRELQTSKLHRHHDFFFFVLIQKPFIQMSIILRMLWD